MSPAKDKSPPSSPSADPHGYARRHNLCTNYQEGESSVLELTDGTSYVIEDDDAELQDSDDDWRLERMEIEKSTLAYLATMQRLEKHDEGLLASDLLGWRDLHMDHPTLCHDHDLHIGKIQKRYSDLPCLRLINQLQQEHRDMFDDLVTTDSHDAADQELKILEVSTDTAHAIREILELQRLDLKDVWQALPSLQESFHDIKEDEPILPIFTNIKDASEATSPLLRPALLSDINENSGLSDSSILDLQISQEDLEDMVAEDTFQLLNESDQAISHQNIVDHARFEGLKITSPLLRPSNDVNSQTNAKTGPRQHYSSDLLPSTSSIQLPSIDAEISGSLLPSYRAKHDLDHEIEHERLVDIDTTLRIPLPRLQAIEIDEPWQSKIATVGKTEEHKRQLRLCRSLLSLFKWRGLSKLERRLTWKPFTFSDMSNYDLLGQEVFAKRIADQYPPIDQISLIDMALSVQPRPSSHTQDSDGAFEQPLLPFQTISDIDHIHSQSIPDANITLQRPLLNNMTAALYKRKREMDGESANKRTHTGQTIDRRTSAKPTGCGGEPSMAMFLSLQGIHAGETHGIDHDTQKQTLLPITDARLINNTTDNSKARRSLPIPACQIAAISAQIIVTTATMSRRSLIEKLIKQAQHVEMIERTSSQARSGYTIVEADISLSPSSGLMLTTLQQIKQKRLPGQDHGKQDLGLRQQIAQVAQRYEDITILVSEGRAEKLDSTEYQDLTDADCESLADLIAWSTSLSTTVDVTYVAGGETELSHWISGHIISNAQSIRLMSEESRWERYLRFCGFNAYAAQVILADLDRHSAAETSSSTLLKLMNLSKAEKDRISILLGGKKNLNCLMFVGTWYHKHVKLWNHGLDSGKHQPQWL